MVMPSILPEKGHRRNKPGALHKRLCLLGGHAGYELIVRHPLKRCASGVCVHTCVYVCVCTHIQHHLGMI